VDITKLPHDFILAAIHLRILSVASRELQDRGLFSEGRVNNNPGEMSLLVIIPDEGIFPGNYL